MVRSTREEREGKSRYEGGSNQHQPGNPQVPAPGTLLRFREQQLWINDIG